MIGIWLYFIMQVQKFGGAPPKKIGAKNMQNSGVFDFDREYLWNGSTYRTSEKKLDNHNPFHVGRKKYGELWSTNKTVLEVHSAY